MLSGINQQQLQQKKVQDYKDLLLGKILSIVSKQKLLPNFLDDLDVKCVNTKKKRLLQYKQTVRKIYSEKNKFPLIYDPQEAYTDRQKLQKKIQLAQNNQLDIEYIQKMRLKQGRIVPTYKGFPLDSINYPTQKEFEMFQGFNEKRFLKSYSQMFDDKLQLNQPSLLRKQRVKTINVIPEEKSQKSLYSSLPKPKFSKFSIDELKQKQKDLKKVKKKIKLRPLTQTVESQRQIKEGIPKKVLNQKYKPHLQKIKVGKMIKDATRSELHHKMLKIGSFPQSVSQTLISLTKQSLAKYLKQFYQRQIRIMDFLQVKPAISLDDYSNLCTKLKLMSVEHVIFMTFLFFDFNNDGYICDNDIRRVKAMIQSKKNHILEEDLKLIEAIKQKKQFHAKILALKPQVNNNNKSMVKQDQDEPNYHELYKLPQVTESTFFQWLNKQKQKVSNKKIHKTQYSQQQQQEEQQQNQQQVSDTNRQKQDKKIVNPFNPSVMKFKYNYFDQRTQVKKYILNIKATKTYINFSQFRKKYIQFEQVNKIIIPSQRQRRLTQNSSNIQKQSLVKDYSMIGLSRHKLSRSQIKIQPIRKESNKVKLKQKILKPFLWYDLMNKLAGIRFQGLKYE